MTSRTLIWILWPSFIVAGAAEALFFTIFDPSDLTFFGFPLSGSRMATYSMGFFLFWVFAACSSALTCFFQRTAAEVNRSSPPSNQRVAGRRNRTDEGASCG